MSEFIFLIITDKDALIGCLVLWMMFLLFFLFSCSEGDVKWMQNKPATRTLIAWCSLLLVPFTHIVVLSILSLALATFTRNIIDENKGANQ